MIRGPRMISLRLLGSDPTDHPGRVTVRVVSAKVATNQITMLPNRFLVWRLEDVGLTVARVV